MDSGLLDNRNFKIISTISIILLMSSCVFKHYDDYVDLGDNFYYLIDGKSTTIYYNLSEDYNNRKGVQIVTPRVVNYSFNEDYIIAKSVSISNENEDYGYWLIAKKYKDRKLYPMDSLSFNLKLKSLEVNLSFEKEDNISKNQK